MTTRASFGIIIAYSSNLIRIPMNRPVNWENGLFFVAQMNLFYIDSVIGIPPFMSEMFG